jgi:NAD(P)-dependent dehydrogenase (short-subunit alcohol dehydrogenase family)
MSPSAEQSAIMRADERVAILTGTSSGFGMLSAIELARKRYRVIATMRDPHNAAELRERAERAGVAGQVSIVALDVTDMLATERVIADTLRLYQRIDLLVNNAGLAVGGFVEDVSLENWRRQMETNFFGLVAMTKGVIPIMRTQRSGLIINISSVSGRVGFPGYAPYAASKFAVEGFSESLRHELAPLGIKVVLLEPGAYRTPIWDKGLAQMSSPDHSPYADRLKAIIRYARRSAETAPDPQQVANFIGRLAETRSPRLRYALGRGALLAIGGKALLPWKWFERLIERGTR